MRFNPLLNQPFTNALINTLSYYTNPQATPVLNQLFFNSLYFRTYSGLFFWKNDLTSIPYFKFFCFNFLKSFTTNSFFPSTRSANNSKLYKPALAALYSLQKTTRFKKLNTPIKCLSRTRANHNLFLHRYVFKYFSQFYSTKLQLFVPFVKVEDFYYTQFNLPDLEFDGNHTASFNKNLLPKQLTTLRRNYFLNTLVKLSKKVRIRKPITVLLNTSSDNYSKLVGVKNLESPINRHPIFSKQLSFLNNFDLNETSFSSTESIKSQFLVEFYDTFTFNYNGSQSIDYNTLVNTPYWDHRLVLLTAHSNSSLFLINQFRQYIVNLNYTLNLDYVRVMRRSAVLPVNPSLGIGGLKTMTKLNELLYYNPLLSGVDFSKTNKIISKLNTNSLYNSLGFVTITRRDRRRKGLRKNSYFSLRLFDKLWLRSKSTPLFKTHPSTTWLNNSKPRVTFDNVIQKGKVYRFFFKIRRSLLRRKRLLRKFITLEMQLKSLQNTTRVQQTESLKLQELYKTSFDPKRVALHFKFRSTLLYRFFTLRLVANRLKKHLYLNRVEALPNYQTTFLNWTGVTKLHFIVWLLTNVVNTLPRKGFNEGGLLINNDINSLMINSRPKLRQILNKTLRVYNEILVNNRLPQQFRWNTHDVLFRVLKTTKIHTNSRRLVRLERLFLRDYERRLLILSYFNFQAKTGVINNLFLNLKLFDSSWKLSNRFLKSQNKNLLLSHSWPFLSRGLTLNLTPDCQVLTRSRQSYLRFFKNYIFFLKKFLKKYKMKVLDEKPLLVSSETTPTSTLFSNQLKRDLRQKYQQFNNLINENSFITRRRSLLPYLYTGIRYIKHALIQNILRYPLYKVLARTRYSLTKYRSWFHKRLQKIKHPSSGDVKSVISTLCYYPTQLNDLIQYTYLLSKRLKIDHTDQHSSATPLKSILNITTPCLQLTTVQTIPTLYKLFYNRHCFSTGGVITFLQNSLKKLHEINSSQGLLSSNNWLRLSQKSNLRNSSPQFILKTSFNISSKPFLQRLTINSYYNLPFIFSNIGFLFITSPNTFWSSEFDYDKSIIQARINSHRYSFFYTNDLKRIYMRKPGLLKVLTFLQNDSTRVEFSETFLPIQFKFPHNYTTGAPYSLLTPTIASKYFKASIDKYRPLNFYKGLGDSLESDISEYTIKRIRFKPGYQRIWRNARAAINFTLKFHFRYQVGLTKKLTRLKNVKRHDAMKLQELKLVNLLMSSQFTFDLNSTRQLIASENVFVNGNLITNPNFNTFVGDFIQLSVSLRYYITYKWLVNWNNYFSLKFTKLLNFKNNSSRSDLSKQTSSTFPHWIFNVGYRRFDIPNFLEVDYLTLSTFIIYEPLSITDYNPLTYLDSRVELYTMYNWKFIT